MNRRPTGLELGVIVAGALAFVASFLPWYGASAGPVSASVSAWHAGATAWVGALLLGLGAVYTALRTGGVNLPTTSYPPTTLLLVDTAAGLLLVIIRWVTLPRGQLLVSYGPRVGIWIALIAGIVEVACAAQLARSPDQPR